ncbi:MAG: subclass B3 metallo-beta-lactamase [Gammaproteobacteria bacterium]|nr:subclass B3 metallo-beta-lactamase [Gammaproteobacteria bacterium]
MKKNLMQVCFCGLLCSLIAEQAFAQRENWSRPFEGFQIIGNLYGVGSYDLSVFLITTNEGHILINTGLEDSTQMIRDNIESLGFRLEDIRILLTQQAHWDHTAALAEIKELTGAEMWATVGDARVLEDGGFSDPHFGGEETFRPIDVDKIIRDGEIIRLGELELTVYHHPGHTEGSSSYAMVVNEDGREYKVLIANMGTINAGKQLTIEPTYPGVAEDFLNTYRRQKAMDVDVWVAAHNSQYNMHEKYRPGQAYDADTFVDPAGFIRAIEALEQSYEEYVSVEQSSN